MGKEKKYVGTRGRLKAMSYLLTNQDEGQPWDVKKNYPIRDMNYDVCVAKKHMDLFESCKYKPNVNLIELDSKYD
jgi:hypothetical protein